MVEMEEITKITKLDIIDLFRNGFEVEELFNIKKIKYYYWGRLDEIDFLKRLYNLSMMTSTDSRFNDAEGDIWQHTLNNDDYLFCWVFEDERFSLLTGDDEILLKFLSEVFHPEVRYEKGYWRELLQEINVLLRNDGYELFCSEKLSGRDVFSWRCYRADENTIFIPFSQRNEKVLKSKKLILTIPKKTRTQLLYLIESCNESFQLSDETGWNYIITTVELSFRDLAQFYQPKCFDGQNKYVETSEIKEFVCNNYPAFVFDALELFAIHTTDKEFEIKANTLLKHNNIPYKFEYGKIVGSFNIQQKNALIAPVQEAGLKELLQDAFDFKEKGELSIAVEKLWDAFERLKTININKDKKASVQKIIKDMSAGQGEFEQLFSDEFITLTKIGNTFRIRHHETDKIDIKDIHHYEYFFNRCYSLIEVATRFLQT
jgi:hypothetical protein